MVCRAEDCPQELFPRSEYRRVSTVQLRSTWFNIHQVDCQWLFDSSLSRSPQLGTVGDTCSTCSTTNNQLAHVHGRPPTALAS